MSKFIALLVILLSITAGLALAQDDLLGSRFFRVTVTQNEKPLLTSSIFEDTSGNLIVKGAALSTVIARAYGVEPFAVVDAPEWVYQSHLYDIEGVPPPAGLIEADAMEMLQSMLADRFALQVRHETREVTMVVLDLDRAKQSELARDAQELRDSGRAPQPPPLPPPGQAPSAEQLALARAYLINRGNVPVSTKALLNAFVRRIGEPILDLTGATTVYVPGLPGVRPTQEENSLASASAELAQYGVILERRAVPLNVVVVTAIERPVLDAVDR